MVLVDSKKIISDIKNGPTPSINLLYRKTKSLEEIEGRRARTHVLQYLLNQEQTSGDMASYIHGKRSSNTITIKSLHIFI